MTQREPLRDQWLVAGGVVDINVLRDGWVAEILRMMAETVPFPLSAITDVFFRVQSVDETLQIVQLAVASHTALQTVTDWWQDGPAP